jgi:hypothetical protein
MDGGRASLLQQRIGDVNCARRAAGESPRPLVQTARRLEPTASGFA